MKIDIFSQTGVDGLKLELLLTLMAFNVPQMNAPLNMTSLINSKENQHISVCVN